MKHLPLILIFVLLASSPGLSQAATVEADVCIYGGTSGGVAAAVQAARMGRKVVIAEPGKHLGGMTSGGLSAVDIGDPRSVGGIAREYFTRLVAAYGKKLVWDAPHTAKGGSGHGTGGAYAIEPHQAEKVFEDMTREAGVKVHFKARLASVKKDGARITELATEDGTVFRAKMFIDATYEGDLMAKAGVSYTLMREGNAKYRETYNGIYYEAQYKPRLGHLPPGANGRTKSGQGVWDRDFPLDPYVVKGDPTSGLLPLLNEGEPGKQGDPAPGVQAYCYRLCLSTAADRLPITPPPDYDAKRYEIVARFIEACQANGDDMDLRWFSKHDELPNQKWDFNTATFGGNLPGASHEWPEAGYARRAEIAKNHENYHRGLLHFLATDPRVPAKVRDDVKRFGLPRDEFTDNGGWPHQLYIREARRMVSDLVLTEHHTHGRQVAPHSIGLGSYGTDTHEVRRIVKDGVVTREGKTGGGRGGFGPYQIGYGAIVPKAGECENLFVTFALSASHTAFSSIRMEPVFMVTSQSAATAACLAIEDAAPVQQVNQAKLRARLLADGQVLETTKPNAAKLKALPEAAPQPPQNPQNPTISHIIVPHSKEAARNGEASLIELRDGSLLLMYGAHQKSGDWDRGEIRQMRSRDGGKTWSQPETVFSDAKRSLFQISFARLANGDLGLTHTSLANGRDAFKVFRRSTDEGQTWSEPLKISDDSHDYTTGPWDKLYVLASGRVIALLHCNLKPDAKKQGGPLGVYTVYSDDHGRTWTRSPLSEVLHVADNPAKKHEWGFWEPALVEHAPAKLLMLGRTTTGWLWESRSEDNGTTWSAPVQSTVPNPVAPPVLTRVPGTDTLVLIHNPDVKLSDSWHGGERVALAFRTSQDSGRTWSTPTDIFRAPNNQLWVDYPAVRWVKGQLHLVWRHINRANPASGLGGTSLYHHILPREAFEARTAPKQSAESNAKPLRILPLGDSITRGSYLAQKDGKATGLPHPQSGGWRKPLQDKLRATGIALNFVGELNYAAFGRDGVVDPQFDSDHHGLAGFSNTGILKGGIVPTPVDVLASLAVKEIKVPGIADVLKKHQPDIILLMSGANGFDAPARDQLIRTIGETSTAHLFVATILPQKAPRAGWEKVNAYNASLPAIVAAQKAAGKRITLVDMHAAITTDDLLPDGVHPNQAGMDKMAAAWFSALQTFR